MSTEKREVWLRVYCASIAFSGDEKSAVYRANNGLIEFKARFDEKDIKSYRENAAR